MSLPKVLNMLSYRLLPAFEFNLRAVRVEHGIENEFVISNISAGVFDGWRVTLNTRSFLYEVSLYYVSRAYHYPPFCLGV